MECPCKVPYFRLSMKWISVIHRRILLSKYSYLFYSLHLSRLREPVFHPLAGNFFIFLQNNKKRAFVLLHPSTQRLLVYFPYSIFLLISVMGTKLNDFELIVNYSKYNSIFLIYLYTPEPGKITGKCFRSSCTLIAISVNIFDETVDFFQCLLILCLPVKTVGPSLI